MKIEKFVLGSMGTNCYLLINETTNELVVVDPATCPDYIINHVRTNRYIPKAILLTHAHFDHMMGIDGWVKEFKLPIYLHENEIGILANPSLNLSAMFGASCSYAIESAEENRGLQDKEILKVAGLSLQVIHTPGHTQGSCCYYEALDGVLISGDTLFYRSVGRSDFPTGNMATLIASIREKLFCLPDDTMVYPGHDRETCIAEEREKNLYLGT